MVLATLEPTMGMKCIQHILLAFNAIFTFTGVILISVGSTVNNIYTDYASFVEARFFSPSIIIISIGILVLVIALFGCYGAFKLSVAAIMAYCVLLATVFILETVAGIAAYMLEDEIEDMLITTLNQTMADYETDTVTANTIDALQYELHCCGIMGPQDWADVLSFEYPHGTVVPISCCAYFERGSCVAIKRMGCLPQLEFLLDQSSLLLTSTVLMIALMQLLGVVFACKLGRQLRKQKTLRDHFKWEVKENILSAHLEEPRMVPEPEYSRLPSYSELFSLKDVNEKPSEPK